MANANTRLARAATVLRTAYRSFLRLMKVGTAGAHHHHPDGGFPDGLGRSSGGSLPRLPGRTTQMRLQMQVVVQAFSV
jgi:hypothetical protein